MADLARKKAVRGSQRAAVTRNVNRITELLLEDPKDPETIAQLKLKKSQLMEKLTIIKRLDQEILDETPEEEMDTEIEVADSTREKIDLAVMQVDQFVALAVEAASHTLLELLQLLLVHQLLVHQSLLRLLVHRFPLRLLVHQFPLQLLAHQFLQLLNLLILVLILHHQLLVSLQTILFL